MTLKGIWILTSLQRKRLQVYRRIRHFLPLNIFSTVWRSFNFQTNVTDNPLIFNKGLSIYVVSCFKSCLSFLPHLCRICLPGNFSIWCAERFFSRVKKDFKVSSTQYRWFWSCSFKDKPGKIARKADYFFCMSWITAKTRVNTLKSLVIINIQHFMPLQQKMLNIDHKRLFAS